MRHFYQAFCEPEGQAGFRRIIILIVLGIALMVVPGLFWGNKAEDAGGEKTVIKEAVELTDSLFALEKVMAEELAQILGQVEGVGRLEVALSLVAGPAQDYLSNQTRQKTNIAEKTLEGGLRETEEVNEKTEYVLVQGRSEPLLLREKSPQVKGVLIVAEGAHDPQIKIKLNRAIQSLFDLSAHRIVILPKESRG